jgi:hypothetical protein
MKLFKNSLYTLMAIAGIAIAVASCGLTDALKVNVPLSASGLQFTIPHTTSAGNDSATFTYTVNLDSLVAAANSSLSTTNITSIKIDTVDITTSNGTVGPPVNNLSNITSASVDFTSDATPGTWTTIAPSFSVPGNTGNSLQLPVDNTINLDSYIAPGNVDTHFTFKLHAALNTAISTDLNCTATIHFTVLAGL